MIAGIDFGTTNSVVCLIDDQGRRHSVRFAAGAQELEVFRTVLNFWEEANGPATRLCHAAGPAGIDAYLDDPLGSRLIMSMKTYLASRSFRETRIFGRTHSLEEMVGLFLRALRTAADCDIPVRHAVVGRPVRFAGEVPDDTFGEQRLRAGFANAGFEAISLALEPEGAGYRFINTLRSPATVLVGDFGGGTSDFSIFRFDPSRSPRVEQLGHAGLAIAGDTFDQRLIDHLVSPSLGRDDTYRILGKDMPIPIGFYRGLAQWHRLCVMRAPRTLAEIQQVARSASHPERLNALIAIIEDEAGYDLYRAIAALKTALSTDQSADFAFRHRGFNVSRRVERADFDAWISEDLSALLGTVERLLADVSLASADIDHVFLTGGTSFVPAVRRRFEELFGPSKLRGGGEFVAVAEGLALIGLDRARAGADGHLPV